MAGSKELGSLAVAIVMIPSPLATPSSEFKSCWRLTLVALPPPLRGEPGAEVASTNGNPKIAIKMKDRLFEYARAHGGKLNTREFQRAYPDANPKTVFSGL